MKSIFPGQGDALLVVDMQNDFLPGGALAVAGADELIPVINALADRFARAGSLVVATADHHPAGHMSFRGQGGPWPVHCVAGTPGARLADGLTLPSGTAVVSKGTRPDQEGYSAFEGTALDKLLQENGIERVYLAGVATDYCVLRTALDARARGLQTVLVGDAIRAVDPAGSGAVALQDMQARGVVVTSSSLTG